MNLKDVIYKAARDGGFLHQENSRSYILKCPSCNETKLHFDKTELNFICFAGKCGVKGQAYKLYGLIKGIAPGEAYKELFKPQEKKTSSLDFDDFFVRREPIIESEGRNFHIPEHFMLLSSLECKDGVDYLTARGIPVEIAQEYGITYSPVLRRVIFPIKMPSGSIVGYQARAIDDVDKKDKMRNNEGFKKGRTVMFMDRAKNHPHIIIAEGPVDAIKFHLCGGNVATLGKEITDAQIRMINGAKAMKVYWALDDDAADLIKGYSEKLLQACYIIQIPIKARSRILASGKTKVDFGECTFQECQEAFRDAKPINYIGGRDEETI